LQPGDTLVLYTDGFSEAQNASGEEFGLQQLREFINAKKLREPCEVVRNCRQLLDGFRGDVERFDDETLLAIRFAPVMNAKPAQRHAYV
jgi:sigma-B regulation protein RsbU (phosphoserine phosphatase)